MFWTEWVFSRLPLYRRGLVAQLPVRVLFLFLVWLVGLAGSLERGSTSSYVMGISPILTVFGTGLIILVGTYGVQARLKNSISSFRPLLDLDDAQFERFSRRLWRYLFSSAPPFLLAGGLFLSISEGLGSFKYSLVGGLPNALFIFLVDLLAATGIWMGFGIWLSVFVISRGPLRLDLSQNTIDKFRDLTELTLLFSLFYFIALSLSVIIPLTVYSQTSMWGLVFSPVLVLIVAGVLLVTQPFYTIHAALLALKRRELAAIETEYSRLQAEFDMATAAPRPSSYELTSALMGQFFSLQIRERKVRLAQEWPVDITFVSRVLLLVLVPVSVRIVIWAFMGVT
jgi:hypothetical protein